MRPKIWEYTREQKITLTVLACIIMTLIVADIFLENSDKRSGNVFLPDSAQLAEIERFEAGLDSFHSQQYDLYPPQPHTPVKTFTFDPNSVDSADFVALGFKPWMAHNLIRYRSAGGQIRNIKKLKSIYGIDTARVNELSAYIIFPSPLPTNDDSETVSYPKSKEFFHIELNAADTSQLKCLPGIGSGRAKMIVHRRNMLGGFHSAVQLYELDEIPDSIITALIPYISVETDSIKRIPINRSSIKRLRRHPYINYYQAKELYDMRWDAVHKGNLKADDMFKTKTFNPKEVERLLPYLDFSDYR